VKIYSVFAPKDASLDPQSDGFLKTSDKIRFVPHGFNIVAFVLPIPWLIVKFMGFVLLAYLALSALIELTGWLGGGLLTMCLVLALAFIFGFEANTLYRWSLRRRGWQEIAVVYAKNNREAERRFFDAWLAKPAAPPQIPQPVLKAKTPYAADPTESGIVGLFPKPEGQR
jgi:hypothetical protein